MIEAILLWTFPIVVIGVLTYFGYRVTHPSPNDLKVIEDKHIADIQEYKNRLYTCSSKYWELYEQVREIGGIEAMRAATQELRSLGYECVTDLHDNRTKWTQAPNQEKATEVFGTVEVREKLDSISVSDLMKDITIDDIKNRKSNTILINE